MSPNFTKTAVTRFVFKLNNVYMYFKVLTTFILNFIYITNIRHETWCYNSSGNDKTCPDIAWCNSDESTLCWNMSASSYIVFLSPWKKFIKSRCRWENSIKMYLREIGWEGMCWIPLAQMGSYNHGNKPLNNMFASSCGSWYYYYLMFLHYAQQSLYFEM
jgi:hypothetical protein